MKSRHAASSSRSDEAGARYAAWFHELDAWTEYWDIYHPESRGRFYFGDGAAEPGLLTLILPRDQRPPIFGAWVRMASEAAEPTADAAKAAFIKEAREPAVAAAVREVDELIESLFRKHFGDATSPQVHSDYLDALHRFATNTLPPATERHARIADDDPRKSTSGHHALEGDIMWFCWALQIEAAQAAATDASGDARRMLSLAGVASGCAANFAWRKHRHTRKEYKDDDKTARLLHDKGMKWARDFEGAAREVHTLYRIREWGPSEG